MKDFFKTTRFKVIICIVALLFGFMIQAAYTGTLSSLPSKIIGTVTAPFQAVATTVSGWFGGFFDRLTLADELLDENQELKKEIQELRGQLTDLDRYKEENANYAQQLQIQQAHPEYKMVTASVIGRDASARFYAFTIDKGTNDGIKNQDPVITSDGLVGLVMEAGPNYSTVMTILDPAFKLGVYTSQSRDTGVVSGDTALSEEGQTKLRYLSRTSTAAEGDMVLTSGMGDIAPKDLLIGTIKSVKPEKNGITKYAVLEPVVDVSSVSTVMVLIEH